MDSGIFWILFIVGIVLGAIPFGGTVFLTLVNLIAQPATPELFGLLLAVIIGSGIVVIICGVTGIISGGLSWLLGAGTLLNFVVAIIWSGLILFGIIGGIITAIFSVAIVQKGAKKTNRRCVTILGRDICIGQK